MVDSVEDENEDFLVVLGVSGLLDVCGDPALFTGGGSTKAVVEMRGGDGLCLEGGSVISGLEGFGREGISGFSAAGGGTDDGGKRRRGCPIEGLPGGCGLLKSGVSGESWPSDLPVDLPVDLPEPGEDLAESDPSFMAKRCSCLFLRASMSRSITPRATRARLNLKLPSILLDIGELICESIGCWRPKLPPKRNLLCSVEASW